MASEVLKKFYAFPRNALVRIYRMVTRIRPHNLVNIPENTSVLLAVNHTTGIDPIILLVALKKEIYFIADADNFKNGVSEFFMRKITNSIPIYQDRHNKNPATLKEMICIRNRENAIFGYFPEGRRHRTSSFNKLYRGAAYFSYKLDIPLLPVYIHKHLKGPSRESFLGRSRILEGLIAITINISRKINVFVGKPVYPFKDQSEAKIPGDRSHIQPAPYYYRAKINRIHKEMIGQFESLRQLSEHYEF